MHLPLTALTCLSPNARAMGGVLVGVLVGALLHPAAQAQPTAPADPADALRRQQQQLDQLIPARPAPAQPAVPAPHRPLPADATLPTDEQPCARISEISLTGPDAAAFTWLLDTLGGPQRNDAPLRRCLGARGLAVVQQRAQQALIDAGYITSRVLVAPQDLASGSLRLSVFGGRVRQVRASDDSPARHSLATASALQPGDLLRVQDIEQTLDNLRRLPSVQAQARIDPASADEPGDSDVVFTLRQDRAARLRLSLDDAGPRATGRLQFGVGAVFDQPLALNDQLQIQVQSDIGGHIDGRPAGPRGAQSRNLAWTMAAGPWSVALTHGQQRYHQRVAGTTQDYTYSGHLTSTDAQVQRVLWRGSSADLSLGLKAFAHRSGNAIDDQPIATQERATGGWTLSLQHRRALGSAVLDLGATWQRGTGAFGARSAPEAVFDEGTSRFRLLQLTAGVDAAAPAFGRGARYAARWQAQLNDGPVAPPQRMTLGGRSSVRGFDGERSLSGERGWLLRQDLSWPLGPTGAVRVYAALDHGRAGGPAVQAQIGRQLSGAVLGLRGRIGGAGEPAAAATWFDLFVGAPLAQPDGFGPRGAIAGFTVGVDL